MSAYKRTLEGHELQQELLNEAHALAIQLADQIERLKEYNCDIVTTAMAEEIRDQLADATITAATY